MINYPLPILGFAAWSGTGKTTLLTQLIPLLKARGLKVVLIKHAHHSFSIDHPGKDSCRFREAGASQVVIASKKCIASIMDTSENETEPLLEDALSAISPQQLDLVLVEGFKKADIPKIELHRQALAKTYFYPSDKMIIALAEDTLDKRNEAISRTLPHLDLNQPEQIATFIEQWLHQERNYKAYPFSVDSINRCKSAFT